MQNPWIKIPQNRPYVLEEDESMIEDFNKTSRNKIVLDSIPEPYLGDPFNCKVVLLNLNPGHDNFDYEWHNNNDVFRELSFKNLHHEHLEHPFYLLNPQLKKAPGSIWWRKYLKRLISDVGLKKITQDLCVIEIFPYHTIDKTGIQKLFSIPSIRYNYSLVRQIIDKAIPIIIMRSKKEWLTQVPELRDYNYYELKSVQSVWITPNNVTNNGYNTILEVLS